MEVAPVSTGRRRAFRIVTVVLGIALAALAAFSLVAVVALGERAIHRVHDLATVIQVGLLLAVPMIVQARNPEKKIALMQLIVLTMAAFGVAYALSGAAWALIGLLLVAGLIWLHPARGRLLAGGPFSIPLALLVVAAFVLFGEHALEEAGIQRVGASVITDEIDGTHWKEFHWASMAAIALGLPLAGVAATIGATGWRIVAWLVGIAWIVLGAGFLAFPDHPSSLGETAGIVLVAGGVVFILVAQWEARRRPVL